MRVDATIQEHADRLGQQQDILAAIEPPGGEYHQPRRRNAVTFGKPGAVAPRRMEQRAVDPTAQQARAPGHRPVQIVKLFGA